MKHARPRGRLAFILPRMPRISHLRVASASYLHLPRRRLRFVPLSLVFRRGRPGAAASLVPAQAAPSNGDIVLAPRFVFNIRLFTTLAGYVGGGATAERLDSSFPAKPFSPVARPAIIRLGDIPVVRQLPGRKVVTRRERRLFARRLTHSQSKRGYSKAFGQLEPLRMDLPSIAGGLRRKEETSAMAVRLSPRGMFQAADDDGTLPPHVGMQPLPLLTYLEAKGTTRRRQENAHLGLSAGLSRVPGATIDGIASGPIRPPSMQRRMSRGRWTGAYLMFPVLRCQRTPAAVVDPIAPRGMRFTSREASMDSVRQTGGRPVLVRMDRRHGIAESDPSLHRGSPSGSRIEATPSRLPTLLRGQRWREQGDETARAAPAQAVVPVEFAYRRSSEAPMSANAAPPARAPEPVPAIDLDRLSRDVWRQLDKRLRIERERRGRG
ncbi:hypothetical protein DF3PB_140007 [uncultured Defluviicoccus sp.]|uniref:Uncharacterized protein n=1 Tax=metagenome TaxID=256318 RepID=A0A380TBA8_9ZZZZ|nr:hypothetical protein DF3PB_140007 [uncultured Defluviicoccus sp.]